MAESRVAAVSRQLLVQGDDANSVVAAISRQMLVKGDLANAQVVAISRQFLVEVAPGTPTTFDIVESTITGEVGATVRLHGNVYDQYGRPMPDVPITWESANESIATVDASGLVTFVAAGTTTVSGTVVALDDTVNVIATGTVAPAGGESGDTSELSGVEVGLGNTITSEAEAAISGGFGYRVTYGGVNAKARGKIHVAPKGNHIYRHSFRLVTGFALPANGDKITVLELLTDTASVVQVQVIRNDAAAGGYELGVRYRGTTEVYEESLFHDTVYSLEIHHRADASKGRMRASANNAKVREDTSLANPNEVITRIWFGSTDPITSPDTVPDSGGEVDHDDIIVEPAGGGVDRRRYRNQRFFT